MLFRDQDAIDDDPHEKEANSFAANLLVPRFMLDQVWTRYPVEQLSKLFAVSVPVIKNRISFEYGA
jgi:Zn-dependent peptidase ImmA (M78 family)